MSRSLIVLPDDSSKPLIDAINGAKSSLRIKMFVFSDPSLLEAVIAARKRGVDVRVMLNPERRDGEKENAEARERLKAAAVTVKDSNPCFDVTHEKSMVVDGKTAYIQSLNWEARNLTETRDYAVVTSHAHEVGEVTAGFDADWNRTDFVALEGSNVIWCTGNGRQKICEFIDKT
jgi:cardiolipin synthase